MRWLDGAGLCHRRQGKGGLRRKRRGGDQHDRPCGHMSARAPHAQERQAEPYGNAERQRPQRRFQEQVQHYRLPPFAFATLSAKVRSCRWSSMALSTMPTRTSSTDPLQNKSTIRWTALAATFPRGCVALYTKVRPSTT